MKRHPISRGMTLIEVLVATVLLGVGVVGLISVATLSLRNQQRTEHRAAALCLAQEKLAEVELVGPHVWLVGRPMRGQQQQGPIAYDWTLRIDELSAGELYSVLAEVRWAGASSSGTASLETWLNDYRAVAPTTGPPGPESVSGRGAARSPR